MTEPIVLFYNQYTDKDFLPGLKPLLSGVPVILCAKQPETRAEFDMIMSGHGATKAFVSNEHLLPRFISQQENGGKKPSLHDFAGSMFKTDKHEVVILDPIEQIFSVAHGKFVMSRWLSKLTKPEKWMKESPFTWHIANESHIEADFEVLKAADILVVDIETTRPSRTIICVSYTAIKFWKDSFSTHTVVLSISSMFWVSWMRKINNLDIPKCLQNGKFDSSLFFRFNAPLRAYLWDTINLFHSWYSELPKDLAFLTAFSVRNSFNWKNSGKSGNQEQFFRYNALDGWATANALISLLAEAPTWALKNYCMEFPRVFPCHLSEMTGTWVDVERMNGLKEEKAKEDARLTTSLNRMLGKQTFNPGSPQQVVSVIHAFGHKDIKSSSDKVLEGLIFGHPLFARIFESIREIRGHRKLMSTYLKEEKLWDGRNLYSLNPHGTDTDRLASQESHYECGFQIQNIPTDEDIKSMFWAPDGFHMGEADYEQAEARDVAYLSGDKKLIDTVESGKDYHSLNVQLFFGIPYEQVITPDGKVLMKPIRDLSKRTNHGANYNMGAKVLILTMGLKNVYRAAQLLKLPKYMGPEAIAEYLLSCYDKTYPTVRHEYYDWIKKCIKTTSMLLSPTGWTRYCFGDPSKNKRDMNRYAAHPSQNLNAETLNKAYIGIFKNVWMKYPQHFKLHAQIHDSVLFSYRIGHEYLIELVYREMYMRLPVRDITGIERGLVVPVGIKSGGKRWSELKKWSPPEEIKPQLWEPLKNVLTLSVGSLPGR